MTLIPLPVIKMLTKIKNFINSFTESRACIVYDYGELQVMIEKDAELQVMLESSLKKFNDSMYELDLLREQSAGRIYDV